MDINNAEKREKQLEERLERIRALEDEIIEREKALKNRENAKKQRKLTAHPARLTAISSPKLLYCLFVPISSPYGVTESSFTPIPNAKIVIRCPSS